MNTKQMYERVSLVAVVHQRDFFDRLNDTLIELGSLYGDAPKLLYAENGDGTFTANQWITDLETVPVILPLYHASIVDNILFLSGAGEYYKGEFLRKSKDAWLKYWNVNAKGNNVRNRMGVCSRV